MIAYLIYFFREVPLFIGLVASVIFFLYSRHLEWRERVAASLIVVYFFFDALSNWISYHHHTNQWLYNLACPVEVLIPLWVYYQIITSRLVKRMVPVFALLYCVGYVLNRMYVQGSDHLNTFTLLPAMAVLAILAFLHLEQCMADLDHSPFDNFFFWFSLANLIDNTGGFSYISTLPWFAYQHPHVVSRLKMVNDFFYCSWFVTVSIGLIWKKKALKSFSL